jgi:hypothetical protein
MRHEDTLEYGCVLDVYDENGRWSKEKKAKYKQKADAWVVFEILRQEIHYRARLFWARRSGKDPLDFGMSVDEVCRIYLTIRKRNKNQIARKAQALGVQH